MDFHTMKRKELQALCKTHKIPANLTNLEMADRLASLLEIKAERPKEERLKKSCLKNCDEISDFDGKNSEEKEGKKVRFSPLDQTFEFEKTNPRAARLAMRKSVVIAEEEVVDGGKSLRNRGRGRKTEQVDVVEVEPESKVVTRRSIRSVGIGSNNESAELCEKVEVEEKVVDNGVKSLRNRGKGRKTEQVDVVKAESEAKLVSRRSVRNVGIGRNIESAELSGQVEVEEKVVDNGVKSLTNRGRLRKTEQVDVVEVEPEAKIVTRRSVRNVGIERNNESAELSEQVENVKLAKGKGSSGCVAKASTRCLKGNSSKEGVGKATDEVKVSCSTRQQKKEIVAETAIVVEKTFTQCLRRNTVKDAVGKAVEDVLEEGKDKAMAVRTTRQKKVEIGPSETVSSGEVDVVEKNSKRCLRRNNASKDVGGIAIECAKEDKNEKVRVGCMTQQLKADKGLDEVVAPGTVTVVEKAPTRCLRKNASKDAGGKAIIEEKAAKKGGRVLNATVSAIESAAVVEQCKHVATKRGSLAPGKHNDQANCPANGKVSTVEHVEEIQADVETAQLVRSIDYVKVSEAEDLLNSVDEATHAQNTLCSNSSADHVEVLQTIVESADLVDICKTDDLPTSVCKGAVKEAAQLVKPVDSVKVSEAKDLQNYAGDAMDAPNTLCSNSGADHVEVLQAIVESADLVDICKTDDLPTSVCKDAVKEAAQLVKLVESVKVSEAEDLQNSAGDAMDAHNTICSDSSPDLVEDMKTIVEAADLVDISEADDLLTSVCKAEDIQNRLFSESGSIDDNQDNNQPLHQMTLTALLWTECELTAAGGEAESTNESSPEKNSSTEQQENTALPAADEEGVFVGEADEESDGETTAGDDEEADTEITVGDDEETDTEITVGDDEEVDIDKEEECREPEVLSDDAEIVLPSSRFQSLSLNSPSAVSRSLINGSKTKLEYSSDKFSGISLPASERGFKGNDQLLHQMTLTTLLRTECELTTVGGEAEGTNESIPEKNLSMEQQENTALPADEEGVFVGEADEESDGETTVKDDEEADTDKEDECREVDVSTDDAEIVLLPSSGFQSSPLSSTSSVSRSLNDGGKTKVEYSNDKFSGISLNASEHGIRGLHECVLATAGGEAESTNESSPEKNLSAEQQMNTAFSADEEAYEESDGETTVGDDEETDTDKEEEYKEEAEVSLDDADILLLLPSSGFQSSPLSSTSAVSRSLMDGSKTKLEYSKDEFSGMYLPASEHGFKDTYHIQQETESEPNNNGEGSLINNIELEDHTIRAEPISSNEQVHLTGTRGTVDSITSKDDQSGHALSLAKEEGVIFDFYHQEDQILNAEQIAGSKFYPLNEFQSWLDAPAVLSTVVSNEPVNPKADKYLDHIRTLESCKNVGNDLEVERVTPTEIVHEQSEDIDTCISDRSNDPAECEGTYKVLPEEETDSEIYDIASLFRLENDEMDKKENSDSQMTFEEETYWIASLFESDNEEMGSAISNKLEGVAEVYEEKDAAESFRETHVVSGILNSSAVCMEEAFGSMAKMQNVSPPPAYYNNSKLELVSGLKNLEVSSAGDNDQQPAHQSILSLKEIMDEAGESHHQNLTEVYIGCADENVHTTLQEVLVEPISMYDSDLNNCELDSEISSEDYECKDQKDSSSHVSFLVSCELELADACNASLLEDNMVAVSEATLDGVSPNSYPPVPNVLKGLEEKIIFPSPVEEANIYDDARSTVEVVAPFPVKEMYSTKYIESEEENLEENSEEEELEEEEYENNEAEPNVLEGSEEKLTLPTSVVAPSPDEELYSIKHVESEEDNSEEEVLEEYENNEENEAEPNVLEGSEEKLTLPTSLVAPYLDEELYSIKHMESKEDNSEEEVLEEYENNEHNKAEPNALEGSDEELSSTKHMESEEEVLEEYENKYKNEAEPNFLEGSEEKLILPTSVAAPNSDEELYSTKNIESEEDLEVVEYEDNDKNEAEPNVLEGSKEKLTLPTSVEEANAICTKFIESEEDVLGLAVFDSVSEQTGEQENIEMLGEMAHTAKDDELHDRDAEEKFSLTLETEVDDQEGYGEAQNHNEDSSVDSDNAHPSPLKEGKGLISMEKVNEGVGIDSFTSDIIDDNAGSTGVQEQGITLESNLQFCGHENTHCSNLAEESTQSPVLVNECTDTVGMELTSYETALFAADDNFGDETGALDYQTSETSLLTSKIDCSEKKDERADMEQVAGDENNEQRVELSEDTLFDSVVCDKVNTAQCKIFEVFTGIIDRALENAATNEAKKDLFVGLMEEDIGLASEICSTAFTDEVNEAPVTASFLGTSSDIPADEYKNADVKGISNLSVVNMENMDFGGSARLLTPIPGPSHSVEEMDTIKQTCAEEDVHVHENGPNKVFEHAGQETDDANAFICEAEDLSYATSETGLPRSGKDVKDMKEGALSSKGDITPRPKTKALGANLEKGEKSYRKPTSATNQKKRSILIHGTPRRAVATADLKENSSAQFKRNHLANATAAKPLGGRKALGELSISRWRP